MRKALVVGIDYYEKVPQLHGCVSDADAVKNVLERHADGTVNFHVRPFLGIGTNDVISRSVLKELIRELFEGENETALFYFAGHGHIEPAGGYLLPSDCERGDDGVPLHEVLTLANGSRARNKIIVLDSCYSGIAGSRPLTPQTSELTEGLTILTASTCDQYASEANGSGVFTSLFVDALSGAAGNLVGDITPGSVYAHIDQSLGPWDQRPVFKTNVRTFVSLRKVQPPISLPDLRRITEFFPTPSVYLGLDPSFEPERPGPAWADIPPPNPENAQRFSILQQYNRVNLVVPVGAPHMWHAAMGSKSCKLTVLGRHYWKLVNRGLI